MLIHREPLLRVVRATDTPEHPAFYRVILNAHVAEFSALAAPERQRVMDVVVEVERQVLALLKPIKVNLASLGNMVPHLHWHVIARVGDDAQFPAPIWAPAVRAGDPARLQAWQAALPRLDEGIAAALR
ncbi:diadenosine tetraphosphate (Ap4A) HIT family hydrolase [Inhella inkyongensis]|uniref:Diadenosine tetraphosphate (Ap4A) HIT family hydrolase n=1 Tax=Inhella inkyongensis TaxID=392593 RepID=A0A840S4I1_9BURK|nr:HIT family protein [Inhella inkyongensis]MBB5204368.1 diadenosine tetraphosphate (Ap4A) HIT family hydrolase [Inhella inkyongensis]